MIERRPSTLERAFQIARLGTVGSVEDIRRALRVEQFENIDAHTAGSLVKRQLMQAVNAGKRARLAGTSSCSRAAEGSGPQANGFRASASTVEREGIG